jgi:RNA polymerase sigma-70 factor (ECF subfamily)
VSNLEERLKKLFLLAKAGNDSAYRELLEGIAVLLRAYLTKTMNPRLRSREQVEDLVQEVLISIHRKRDLYQIDRPLLPWIYAIARYRLIDSLRSSARRIECVEWIEKFDALASVEMPVIDDDPELSELLDGLNVRQKQILMLAKVDELSVQEIADQLGMSLSAVKVTIHRALKMLRKKSGNDRYEN